MDSQPIRVFSWRALPWVLFAISLSLNVFFVGGHYYSEARDQAALSRQAGTAKPKATPTRLTVEQIGLDVAQRGEFLKMRSRIRARGERFRSGSRG